MDISIYVKYGKDRTEHKLQGKQDIGLKGHGPTVTTRVQAQLTGHWGPLWSSEVGWGMSQAMAAGPGEGAEGMVEGNREDTGLLDSSDVGRSCVRSSWSSSSSSSSTSVFDCVSVSSPSSSLT